MSRCEFFGVTSIEEPLHFSILTKNWNIDSV